MIRGFGERASCEKNMVNPKSRIQGLRVSAGSTGAGPRNWSPSNQATVWLQRTKLTPRQRQHKMREFSKLQRRAGVAELADAQDLGSCGLKAVEVQVLSPAPHLF